MPDITDKTKTELNNLVLYWLTCEDDARRAYRRQAKVTYGKDVTEYPSFEGMLCLVTTH